MVYGLLEATIAFKDTIKGNEVSDGLGERVQDVALGPQV